MWLTMLSKDLEEGVEFIHATATKPEVDIEKIPCSLNLRRVQKRSLFIKCKGHQTKYSKKQLEKCNDIYEVSQDSDLSVVGNLKILLSYCMDNNDGDCGPYHSQNHKGNYTGKKLKFMLGSSVQDGIMVHIKDIAKDLVMATLLSEIVYNGHEWTGICFRKLSDDDCIRVGFTVGDKY